MQLLLVKGPNINIHGRENGIALQAASYGGHIEVVQLLLEKGADINTYGGICESTFQATSFQGRGEMGAEDLGI